MLAVTSALAACDRGDRDAVAESSPTAHAAVATPAPATPPVPSPAWSAPAQEAQDAVDLARPAPLGFVSQRAEFEALAAELHDGDNPYLGRASVDVLRACLADDAVDAPSRLQSTVALANKLLELGEEHEAVQLLLQATALAERLFGEAARSRLGYVYARLCVAWLRESEVENCVLRNNARSCVFPLEGGGRHVVGQSARRAFELLQLMARAQHDDLTAVWLLNVAAMAVGEYPAGVPPDLLLPPSAFASEGDVGRFEQAAKRLGVDAFSLCGGVACDDFDGDGWLDLLTSSFDPSQPHVLYRNTGQGGFEDASAASRVDDQLGGLNLVAGDPDGDGDQDVLVLRGGWMKQDGRMRNSLLLNDGAGVFRDATRAAGLADPARPTQTAVFGDFDGDGRLDLYVGNESRLPEDPSGDNPCQLFHNRGDGTFLDVAREAGVTNDRYAKGVTVGDCDNDGDLDLYVSNVGPNRLYRNQGDGTFIDRAPIDGVVEPSGRSFATWFFDQDQDGWIDLFVAAFRADPGDLAAQALGRPHHAELPRLYRNQRGAGFVDVAAQLGLSRVMLPMGANFGDIDDDGWFDIYLTTGDPSFETLMPNVMLRADQGRGYQDVTVSGGFGHLQKGHGVAFADLDHDGDQDIYHQLGGFYPGDAFYNALFLNPGHDQHWLKLELVGVSANRGAVGARVRVVLQTPNGLRTLQRAVGSVSSFGGSPHRVELGLSRALGVQRLEVDWPPPRMGTQVVLGVPMDAFVRITEGRDGFEQLPLPHERF